MHKDKTSYKTSICRHYAQKGYCSLFDKCHFAHGTHELRGRGDPVPPQLPPPIEPVSIYKTTLCKYYMNGFCRNAYMCPFAHGFNDIHQIVVKNNEPVVQQDDFGNAGQFLYSILKSLESVFAGDEDKRVLIKRGMESVQEKDLLKADEIITQIVKCRSLTPEQSTQCQTILENAYALHKISLRPF